MIKAKQAYCRYYQSLTLQYYTILYYKYHIVVSLLAHLQMHWGLVLFHNPISDHDTTALEIIQKNLLCFG